ncbi:CBS domain-containing protein [Nocardia transvalensis]|uniref:CBS domain-containing protein n=1 Tax=Nocardia transvalensis TaxID=37333 RepID=A0A7W9PHJ3_9NOCA|nr:CBS domain-containing protein [Nocardia transvalensis]MBB5916045.1 CBS domain-containing protein [Nocardia transvalensis]
MTTARELMSTDVVWARPGDTVVEAARRMAAAGVGVLPVCGADGSLAGMLTDRDIVVKVVAAQADPNGVRVSELARGVPAVVQADENVAVALTAMAEGRGRRVPVLDDTTLVGIVEQGDLARALKSDTSARVAES